MSSFSPGSEFYTGGSAGVANNATAFAALFGTGRRILLPGQTCAVGSTLTLSASNVWIRGVPGLTKITSSAVNSILRLGAVASVVIEDVIWETTRSSAGEDVNGVVWGDQGLSKIQFIRCGFIGLDAYVNALKFVAESGPAEIDGLAFYDCWIEGAGRIGLEIQNNASADIRYERVVWDGGYIKDTGLKGANGFGVSFGGPGRNCKFDTVVENPYAYAVEMVSLSASDISYRYKSLTRGVDDKCNPLSTSTVNSVIGEDNSFHDIKGLDRATGKVNMSGQKRPKGARNYYLTAQDANYSDVTDGRFVQETYDTTAQTALTLYSTAGTKNNHWDRPIIDNSTNGSSAAAVRFSGANTTLNQVNAPVLKKGTGGNYADQVDSATLNVVIDPVDGNGAALGGLRSVTVAGSNLDLTGDPIAYKAYKYVGTPVAGRDIVMPSSANFNAEHINACGQTLTLKKSGGTGETLADAGRKRSIYDGSDIVLA